MNNSLTSPEEAAQRMYEACAPLIPVYGTFCELELASNVTSEQCIYDLILWMRIDGLLKPVRVQCHVLRTDAGWTDGLYRVLASPGSKQGWAYTFDMSEEDPQPRPVSL